MFNVLVKLDTIQKVKEFVNDTAHCKGDVTLSSGSYKVDGKSIMGILSLNLNNTLTVELSEPDDVGYIKKYYLN